jgi:hypothetical protein
MKTTTAAVTMVYNEPNMLPRWIGYYSKNFGAAACYVVDHGSDDSSTALLDINVLRIPRSPMNDKKRAAFLSTFCSSLLQWYDKVIYTDVDEFLVPDPDSYSSLQEFCQRNETSVATAIGFNVQHVPDLEGPLVPNVPILRQRRWVRFNFAMCKPLITAVPITWTPGFHSSEHPTMFDRLFLFHLHNYDLTIAMQRLSKTRDMKWDDGGPDNHQRWSDEKYQEMILAIAKLPKVEDVTLNAEDPYTTRLTQWISKFVRENPEKRHLFYYNNGVHCNELLRIPERFIDLI